MRSGGLFLFFLSLFLAAIILLRIRDPFWPQQDLATDSRSESPRVTGNHLQSSFILALVTGHSASSRSSRVSADPDLAA